MQIYGNRMNKRFYMFVVLMLWLAGDTFTQNAYPPDWPKRVIWYQIFPDRFCNGDSTNDPTLDDIKGCWPHDDTSAWHLSPWTSDWYAFQQWEKQNGKDIWYQLQRRRYGGDLQGILDKLDYIQELGIGAIYLNPVFMAPSLHKYDAAMYHHIEPTFGPDPEGDKKMIATENPADPSTWKWTSADLLALKLIDECHKRNIRVIFDGVFNHMGRNSFAFKDVVLNQEKSIYKDWFIIDSWADSIAGTEFKYRGWFGVPDLPEIREDENGIVAGPKEYIFACTKRWMAPDGVVANGIDGWRLDVAFCVDHDFWKDWRIFVKEINPQSYLTAEVIDKIEEVQPYLAGDEFDAVMNYGFAVICSEFFINRKQRISVTEFDSLLRQLREAYPSYSTYVMQNLYDSHDTQRFTSYLHNPDVARFRTWGEYFNLTKATNPVYNTGKPTAEEYKIQKLMALFQFTYVGAPMIYYGDEVGMWGANDPDCRKPMVWSELTYEDEQYHPGGTLKATIDPVAPDTALLEFYKSLAMIRNFNMELQRGEYKTLYISDKKGIYVFERSFTDKRTVIVLNNSEKDQKFTMTRSGSKVLVDLFGKGEFWPRGNQYKISCPAQTGMILVEFEKQFFYPDIENGN